MMVTKLKYWISASIGAFFAILAFILLLLLVGVTQKGFFFFLIFLICVLATLFLGSLMTKEKQKAWLQKLFYIRICEFLLLVFVIIFAYFFRFKVAGSFIVLGILVFDRILAVFIRNYKLKIGE